MKTTNEIFDKKIKTINTIKSKYPKAIILLRVDDSYELIGDDAKIVAHITNSSLSTRKTPLNGETNICGFPYYSLETYLPMIVKNGYQVAICDELTKLQTT